jgi:maltose alpha-D-glucosyltransferase/alpha-amylase
MLLAEANQWPEDAAAYFGKGDECHMNFHFPVMPRLFMSIHMEDRFPVIDILQQTPQIPESCQWALFLRNHDELTLEMVTDEDRDYMYRAYAHDRQARINLGIRRRLAPLLGNQRRRIELMNGLLLSLPGTPVIYYADEIGMGDNIYLGDRNGVRTPMQWSADRNAGFSRANPQRLYLPVVIDPEYQYEANNVQAQQANPSSLLWWMKRIIALRKRYRAFGRGSIEFLYPENNRVLAFLRRYENEDLLVVANLSRFAQYAGLDLSSFRGATPVELFGQTRFPRVGEQPYFVTLGPHSFLWFLLDPPRAAEVRTAAEAEPLPMLQAGETWDSLLTREGRAELERVLPSFLKKRRWFGGKARQVSGVRVVETIGLPLGGGTAYLCLVRVHYTQGGDETYVLPLAYAAGEQAERVRREQPRAIVARMRLGTGAESGGLREEGLIYDAIGDRTFAEGLLHAIAERKRFRGGDGRLLALPTRGAREPLDLAGPVPEPSVLQGEQSNTSVLFGSRWILKLFRRIEPGINPDLEIGRFLTERTSFAHVPAVLGTLEYRKGRHEPLSVGLLQSFVPNEGDAWRYTLGALGVYFEQILARRDELDEPTLPQQPLIELAAGRIPVQAEELIGAYLDSAQLLSERTAGLHLALASDPDHPDFAPEPVPPQHQRALYQSVRAMSLKALQLLRQHLGELPEPVQPKAHRLLELEETLATQLLPRSEDRVPTDPLPRRLSFGAGAVHGPRLCHPGLRGRAGALARRAAAAALGAAGRGGHAPLVPLRGRPCPEVRSDPRRGGPGARAVGQVLGAVGLGRVPPLVPAGVRRCGIPARDKRGDPGAPAHPAPREGALRAAVRAEQPSRLGRDPADGSASAGRLTG